jgi:hypothetical protein
LRLQHREDRHQEDLEVEHQRPVLYVVVVPLDTVGDRGLSAQTVDLGPAGDAGLSLSAGPGKRGMRSRNMSHELGPLGTRTDQAHVPREGR